jgi:type IV secretion system protein TrbL
MYFRRWIERLPLVLLPLFCVLCVASEALAQVVPGVKPGNPDSVVAMTLAASRAWRHSMISQGRGLFWGLATIETAYRWGKQALAGELKSFVPSLYDTLLRVGFFAFLLESSDMIVPAILQSLQQAGAQAASAAAGGTPVTPQALYDAAVKLLTTVWNQYSGLELLDHVDVIFGTAIAFITYGLCAAYIWLCQMRAHLVAGGGAIMLAFGGSTWTSHYVTGYLRALVACGINLLVLELIKGVTLPNMEQWLAYSTREGVEIQDTLEMALSAIALPVFVISAPSAVSSIATGSPPSPVAEAVALASTMKALQLATGAMSSAAGALSKVAGKIGSAAYQGAKSALGGAGGSSDSRTTPPSPSGPSGPRGSSGGASASPSAPAPSGPRGPQPSGGGDGASRPPAATPAGPAAAVAASAPAGASSPAQEAGAARTSSQQAGKTSAATQKVDPEDSRASPSSSRNASAATQRVAPEYGRGEASSKSGGEELGASGASAAADRYRGTQSPTRATPSAPPGAGTNDAPARGTSQARTPSEQGSAKGPGVRDA